jgi:hypothetical protein
MPIMFYGMVVSVITTIINSSFILISYYWIEAIQSNAMQCMVTVVYDSWSIKDDRISVTISMDCPCGLLDRCNL